ncbi:hypothetical protein GCM10010469_64840 [Streptomyces labedae]|uniref:Transposase n=2 Tax=Streptomyces TaxID=1883 RepID=A0ABP7YSB5_9ACTN
MSSAVSQFFWEPPSKDLVRAPPSGPGPIPTDRPPGYWAVSWKGAPMGRHRRPTRWDRIRLWTVKCRRRWILRLFGW